METNEEFELLLEQSIQAEIADRRIELEQEIQRVNPELKVHQGSSKTQRAKNQRDVVTIITAVAALSPLVVPIVKEILKRTMPQIETELVIEEGLEGRKIIRIIRKEK